MHGLPLGFEILLLAIFYWPWVLGALLWIAGMLWAVRYTRKYYDASRRWKLVVLWPLLVLGLWLWRT